MAEKKDLPVFKLDESKLVKAESKVAGVVDFKYVDDEAFFGNTEIPKETFKAVAVHNKAYLDAVALFIKDNAAAVFRAEDINERVNVVLPYGGVDGRNAGKVETSVFKKRTYAGSPLGDGKPVTKSVIQLTVVDPSLKPTQKLLTELAGALTEEFVK